MFKILDKRNGEVTAEQQAVFNKISTNNADGYVDGFLNSLRIAKMSSNVISVDSGLLSIQGFRSVNDTLTTYTVSVTPSEPIPFQLVATYSHFISDENDTLEITTRPTQELRREPLFAGQNAVYEVELAEFNMTEDGIADFAVTLEKIVYNEQDLTELLDKVTKAEQDSATALKKVNELETQVIEKQGTAVYVGGEAQSRVNFTSDPQEQIDGKAETDGTYPRMTVGKATNANQLGGVDATNYTKLSQVVRTDKKVGVIEATSAEANFYLYNKSIVTAQEAATSTITQAGWYRIAEIPSYFEGTLTVIKNYNYGLGFACSINVQVGETSTTRPQITVASSNQSANDNNISQVRYTHSSDNSRAYLDVYINYTGKNNWWVFADGACGYESIINIFKVHSFTPVDAGNGNYLLNIGTDAGIYSLGNYYSNGSPVLVGSAPTWVTGTSGSLKLPSAGWYYLQASSNSDFGNNFGNSGIVYVDITKLPVWFPLPQNLNPDSSYSIESIYGTLYAKTGSDTSTWYIRYYKLA